MTAFVEGARALFSAGLVSQSSHLASSSSSTTPSGFVSPDRQVSLRASFSTLPSATFYNHQNPAKMDAMWQRFQNIQFRLGRDPRRPQEERKKVVVLGTGWGAMQFITHLDVAKYDVTIISPRNYFAFTPLLPSVAAGTLTPRSCMEPIRDKLMRGGKKVMEFHEAWATDVHGDKKSITCQTANGNRFDVPYDYLVVAVGAETNTFGIPGVKENAHFLKQVENARQIHKSMLDSFERASIPGVSQEEKQRLLHFVIIGGGPTGVETAAEIADFVREDAKRHYPELVSLVKVTLVEMLPKVLPMFKEEISDYALKNMKRMKIDTVMKTRVTNISKTTITVADADNQSHEIPYGLVLWASGLGNVPFVTTLLSKVEAQKGNRIMKVNEKLQLIGLPNVYALGDCSFFSPKAMATDVDKLYQMATTSSSGASIDWLEKNKVKLEDDYPQIASFDFKSLQSNKTQKLTEQEFSVVLQSIDKAFRPPPPTAQNATQEGNYLSTIFNRHVEEEEKNLAPAYIYRWKGSMAYVGDGQSVVESPRFTRMGGRATNLFWKAFYWSQQMSLNNKLILLSDWNRTRWRGRDVGRDHTQDAFPPTPQ